MSAQRFHKWATILWALLIPPTVLWWHNSILWVALLSIYANMATHWSAFQAARAEEKIEEEVKQ